MLFLSWILQIYFDLEDMLSIQLENSKEYNQKQHFWMLTFYFAMS